MQPWGCVAFYCHHLCCTRVCRQRTSVSREVNLAHSTSTKNSLPLKNKRSDKQPPDQVHEQIWKGLVSNQQGDTLPASPFSRLMHCLEGTVCQPSSPQNEHCGCSSMAEQTCWEGSELTQWREKMPWELGSLQVFLHLLVGIFQLSQPVGRKPSHSVIRSNPTRSLILEGGFSNWRVPS